MIKKMTCHICDNKRSVPTPMNYYKLKKVVNGLEEDFILCNVCANEIFKLNIGGIKSTMAVCKEGKP